MPEEIADRRAQVVRHVGRDLAELNEALFEPLQHRIDGRDQQPGLLWRAALVETKREIVYADGLGFPRQLAQRPQLGTHGQECQCGDQHGSAACQRQDLVAVARQEACPLHYHPAGDDLEITRIAGDPGLGTGSDEGDAGIAGGVQHCRQAERMVHIHDIDLRH